MSKAPPPAKAPETEQDGTASILSDLKSGGEQSVMPDLGGVNPSTPASKFKVHSQTLVIALVLAASGAALYMMRKQGMGAGIRFDPPKIDYNMNKIATPADEKHTQEVLHDLERSQEPTEAMVDKIQKNPFQLDTHGTTEAVSAVDPAALNKARAAAEALDRENAVKTALASVQVDAIMIGPVSLARINGKIIREGDVVADIFKLKSIQDRSVDLEANGKLYTVNITENVGGKPRPQSPRR